MSPAWVSALAVIGASLVTLAGVIYTQRVTRAAQARSEALERSKVDAEAYARARESYEAAIQRLNEEIKRLDRQVRTLRESLDLEQADNIQLRRTLRHIEDTIAQLHDLLERAGVDVPEQLRTLPREADERRRAGGSPSDV